MNRCPWKGTILKGKDCLPNIIFDGQPVSFQDVNSTSFILGPSAVDPPTSLLRFISLLPLDSPFFLVPGKPEITPARVGMKPRVFHDLVGWMTGKNGKFTTKSVGKAAKFDPN